MSPDKRIHTAGIREAFKNLIYTLIVACNLSQNTMKNTRIFKYIFIEIKTSLILSYREIITVCRNSKPLALHLTSDNVCHSQQQCTTHRYTTENNTELRDRKTWTKINRELDPRCLRLIHEPRFSSAILVFDPISLPTVSRDVAGERVKLYEK